MKFNVGFYDFSENVGMNFQLNRFYCLGTMEKEELMEIGRKATDFETWIQLFLEAGEKAAAQGDHLKAAVCYRAAHFYALSDAKDAQGNLLKETLYETCMKHFDAYYSTFPEIQYVRIPFQSGYLPVYFSRPENPKGVIVLHGGYDSLIQEFLSLLPYFAGKGYETYFFEGPGQGEVLMRCHMRMTPEWEHCTSAVLDYFKLDDVTLIGVSLGGYLAPRAAAYDSRIQRVVMFDLIYDFYGAITQKMGEKKAKFFDYMTAHPRNLLWKWLEKKLNENYFTRWLLGQGYAIYENVHTPCEYFNCIKQYNTRQISPLLKQDVLVLAGTEDLYTIYYEEQLKALTNARSVTGRLFTEEEQASHHCQIGNIQLALDTIENWIEKVTDGKKTSTGRR
ncbi:MAG: alpha/beta fold hydrolase [Solobacterium sp.]|nr:alpha/beta fold hydrolase [Solobacterium sp.]